MNFKAGESKSTTSDDREMTEAELQAVSGGWAGIMAYMMAKEQERIDELYRDRI